MSVFLPNAVENEEKLDEYATKGQDPTHDDTRYRLCKERLLRNLTRDLICSHWLLDRLHGSRKREDFITNSSIFDQQSIISRSFDKLGALTHSFLESKVGAEEGEGHRDSKPQSQNGHQSAEGDRC